MSQFWWALNTTKNYEKPFDKLLKALRQLGKFSEERWANKVMVMTWTKGWEQEKTFKQVWTNSLYIAISTVPQPLGSTVQTVTNDQYKNISLEKFAKLIAETFSEY